MGKVSFEEGDLAHKHELAEKPERNGAENEQKQLLVDEVEELFLEGGHLDQDGFGAAGVGGDVVQAEEGAGGFADLGEGDAGSGDQAFHARHRAYVLDVSGQVDCRSGNGEQGGGVPVRTDLQSL